MTTAQQKLAEYGIGMDTAHAYVMANLDHPGDILQIAAQYGVSNAMLGEIAGWPQDAYTAQAVVGFFASHGYDSSSLDAPPSGGHVSVVGDPTFTEGQELVYLVQLHAATTGHLDLPTSLAFGAGGSPADIGQIYATRGIQYIDGTLHVFDAGITSFEVHIVTVDDTLAEPFEQVLLTVDGVTGTGYIADNDASRAAPAALVGVDAPG